MSFLAVLGPEEILAMVLESLLVSLSLGPPSSPCTLDHDGRHPAGAYATAS